MFIIRLWDGAAGFAPVDLPRRFYRFYRGRRAAPEGTVIGLPLALSIFELQSGTITACNLQNGGACFEIRIYSHWDVTLLCYTICKTTWQRGESDMEILKCENVRKVYGTGNNQVIALNHIDLSVQKGEFVAIVGASGSGKSTLLHILGSVDKPTEGKVLIEGTDISTMNRTQAAIFRRRKVGLVYQFYNLIPTLTVRKNILMPLLLDKRIPNQEYFEQIVHPLGIEDKLEALPSQLSGGQQQRAAIARSLIYRPALLLADEPTGNLDRKNGEEIIDLLKLSNRNLNQTILLITHDEKIALEANRIITIEDGKIVDDQKRR